VNQGKRDRQNGEKKEQRVGELSDLSEGITPKRDAKRSPKIIGAESKAQGVAAG